MQIPVEAKREVRLFTGTLLNPISFSDLSLGYWAWSYDTPVQSNLITESNTETAASLPADQPWLSEKKYCQIFCNTDHESYYNPRNCSFLLSSIWFNEKRYWFWKQLCGHIVGWLCHLYTYKHSLTEILLIPRDLSSWLALTLGGNGGWGIE